MTSPRQRYEAERRAEMAERYGAETNVLDWRDRLVCSPVRRPRHRYGCDGNPATL